MVSDAEVAQQADSGVAPESGGIRSRVAVEASPRSMVAVDALGRIALGEVT